MFLQNIYAPLRNFSPNFNDVFAQVIKLGHFYVAANQSLINYLLFAFLWHLVAKIQIGKKEILFRKLLRYSR